MKVDPPEIPPEVNTEVDPPPEVNMEVDCPPTPEVDAEEVVEEDQLRTTAGQAGGMPQKKGFLVLG